MNLFAMTMKYKQPDIEVVTWEGREGERISLKELRATQVEDIEVKIISF
jgi:hypothetical protein